MSIITRNQITIIEVNDGDDAPHLQVQYSVDGSTYWHAPFASGDIYMRTSNDGGATWSAAMKIVGENGSDGVDGSYTEYQFAKSNDPDTAPTVGWYTAPPQVTGEEYLWMRTRTVDGSGTAGEWTDAVRISGVKGETGPSGEDGSSLYTWVAYADDDSGTGISAYPNGKGFIGYAYNQSSSTVNLTDPDIFTWSPFFMDLVATDLEITSNGQIRSGYDENGNPPADGKGFFIDADGRLRARLAEFENSTLNGSFTSKSMDIVDSLGSFSIAPADTGMQVADNFADTPAGFTKITGFGDPDYVGDSTTIELEDLSSAAAGGIPSEPISVLPNGVLITSGSFKKSTDQGVSWTALTPPALPAVPTAPHIWETNEEFETYLIGDGIWAFSRYLVDYYTTTYQQAHQRWVEPVYVCTIPETGYTVTRDSPCPDGYEQTDYTAGYWETYYTTETVYHHDDYYYSYVYIGGSWKLASTTCAGKIAGYSFDGSVYLIVDGHIIVSTDSGASWTEYGTTDVIEQSRFIHFPGSSKIAHITPSGAYITSDGISYFFDSSIKPTCELYCGDTVFLNLGGSVKYSVNGGAFQQKNFPINADSIAKVDDRCVVKSGSRLYMGYDWDAMKKCELAAPLSWKLALNGNILSHTLSKATISKTIYKDETEIFWIFFGSYLKLYIRTSASTYEILIITTSSSGCGYTVGAFALDSGIRLRKPIKVEGGDVDIGTLRSLTAERVRIISTVDASETSTEHGLQIGPDSEKNIIIDVNEIMARDNGALSPLYLQNAVVYLNKMSTTGGGYKHGVLYIAGGAKAIVFSAPSSETWRMSSNQYNEDDNTDRWGAKVGRTANGSNYDYWIRNTHSAGVYYTWMAFRV